MVSSNCTMPTERPTHPREWNITARKSDLVPDLVLGDEGREGVGDFGGFNISRVEKLWDKEALCAAMRGGGGGMGED